MIDSILKLAIKQIANATDLMQLQKVKAELLGKHSALNQQMKTLGSLDPEARKEFGQKINNIRDHIQTLVVQKELELEQIELKASFEKGRLDLSLPVVSRVAGSVHPISQAMEELIQVFSKFGFHIKDGPNIETQWYNFTALNIPENHPARQMHDTFYLPDGKLLRTHTSPIQIRSMENASPPFKLIAPGRTYRSDSDATHTPVFHQIEVLVVDKDITMGHLKYVVMECIRDFFEQDNIEIRFRPSFFPFTEPSAEVDIRMSGSDKWIEVLGSGMVHPNVLKNVGVDSDEYRGFALGLGVERFAMLKYGIKDLRQFFEGDLRWLKHYSFNSFDIPSLISGLTR